MTTPPNGNDEWIDPEPTTTAETGGPSLSEQRERWSAFCRTAGFPRRHREALTRGIDPQWSPAAREWLYPMPRDAMLVLLGAFGTGKTQLATHLAAYHQVLCGWSTRYLTAMELFGRFRRAIDERGDPITPLARVRLLVIDEVHVRHETRYEAVCFTDLIDLRYRECLATVLISNLEEDDFRGLVGEAVYSRVCEVGRVVTLRTPPRR